DDSVYQSHISDIPLSNTEDERTLSVDGDSTDHPSTEAEIVQLAPIWSSPIDKPLVSASDECVDSLAGLSDIFCEHDPYEVFCVAVADAVPLLDFHAIKLQIEGIEPSTLSPMLVPDLASFEDLSLSVKPIAALTGLLTIDFDSLSICDWQSSSEPKSVV
ncbi:unnamed protein product, partial [Didymodactylos carnosus]